MGAYGFNEDKSKHAFPQLVAETYTKNSGETMANFIARTCRRVANLILDGKTIEGLYEMNDNNNGYRSKLIVSVFDFGTNIQMRLISSHGDAGNTTGTLVSKFINFWRTQSGIDYGASFGKTTFRIEGSPSTSGSNPVYGIFENNTGFDGSTMIIKYFDNL